MSFTFVHATDLHYESSPQPDEPFANERIRCFIDDVNRLEGTERPDLVIISGDLSQRGAAVVEDLRGAKAQLDKLRMPYLVVAGNHDLAPHRGFAARYPGKEDYFDGPVEQSGFYSVFGEEGMRFSVGWKGLRFIGVSLRDEEPDRALDWLEEELDRSKGRMDERMVIVGHYGLYPPRDAGPLANWGFARIGSLLPRLRSIVAASGSRPSLYLHGHNHINSLRRIGNLRQLSGGGIQKGCTGFRLFQYNGAKLSCELRLLSEPSLWSFDYWSHSNPGLCVDSSHPSAREYHKGSPSELRAVFDML